jgi:hypothetical protein
MARAGVRLHPSRMEPALHREEAVGMMWTVTDILEELRAIRDLLEGFDGGEEEEAVPEE